MHQRLLCEIKYEAGQLRDGIRPAGRTYWHFPLTESFSARSRLNAPSALAHDGECVQRKSWRTCGVEKNVCMTETRTGSSLIKFASFAIAPLQRSIRLSRNGFFHFILNFAIYHTL